MQPEQVKQLIESQLPDTRVEVDGEGCNFQLLVISDTLAALSPVKRQQQIYALLNEQIADGSIHAVSMKFFSREAWGQRA
ncbi:MAG: BolA family protein [Pseudomonas sp.]